MPKALHSSTALVKNSSSTLSCSASPTKNWKSSATPLKNESYEKPEKTYEICKSSSSSSSSSFRVNDTAHCIF
jgi:hypothetical protein